MNTRNKIPCCSGNRCTPVNMSQSDGSTKSLQRRRFLKVGGGTGLAMLLYQQESFSQAWVYSSPSGVLCCPEGTASQSGVVANLTPDEFSNILSKFKSQVKKEANKIGDGWTVDGDVITGDFAIDNPEIEVTSSSIVATFSTTGAAKGGQCDVTAVVSGVSGGPTAVDPATCEFTVDMKKAKVSGGFYTTTFHFSASFSGSITAREGNKDETATKSDCTYLDGSGHELPGDETCTATTKVTYEVEFTLELSASGSFDWDDTSVFPTVTKTQPYSIAITDANSLDVEKQMSVSETC